MVNFFFTVQMTEGPVKGKKKTSSTSKPRANAMVPSMNSVDSTSSASKPFVNGRLKSSTGNGKMSSQAVSFSKGKKSGKFAFQGQGAQPRINSRQSSPPSDEVTVQQRLFSLEDLKELASIVQSSDSSRARTVADPISSDVSGTKATSKVKAKKTIRKVNKDANGAVAFRRANGKQVSFQSKKSQLTVPEQHQQEYEGVALDMPDLNTGAPHNPFLYAFS